MKVLYNTIGKEYEIVVELKEEILSKKDLPSLVTREQDWHFVFMHYSELYKAEGRFHEQLLSFLSVKNQTNYYALGVWPEADMVMEQNIPVLEFFDKDSGFTYRDAMGLSFYNGKNQGGDYFSFPFAKVFVNESKEWVIFVHHDFELIIVGIKNPDDIVLFRQSFKSSTFLDKKTIFEAMDLYPVIATLEEFKKDFLKNYFSLEPV